MEFKEMHIVCENLEQRKLAMRRLVELGYTLRNNDVRDYEFVIATYEDGEYQTIKHVANYKQIKYKDFMEKYAMTELQKTIEAAKKQGYTNKTLSNALGKHDGYIARIISKPQSEKLQKFLVKKINELLVPAQIDDAMMISKEEYKALNDANANLLNDNSIKSFQISRLENDVADFKEKARSAKAHSEEVVKYSLTLEKELIHKNQVLDKRNDEYNLLEGEFNELKFHFDKQTKGIEKLIKDNDQLVSDKEGLIRTINELEQQNKRVVDSNFELNDFVSVRDATIKNLNQNLNVSREDCNMRASMYITSENKRKKERFWFAGITVALLVLFVISHLV